ncbi:alpha-galactosidase [Streptococcus sanguinis]|uniref:alpha-galactosidase n=1 Tax=Streptococcus sanguinis TaxID=1305 RepID=UPI001CBF7855|nr:alpha-galactosidase [Streptococcus sanguinis]MBZ2068953.1 alpha-galactosidase [Streptococcus sanguinis]MBZ2073565.1 alpha-galactosidase [Streptococcus sanguinis]MBZ2081489.1 alpha-galactosidase [Streptococcus sanguinis]
MNKASILFKEECRQFHLTNGEISYIFRVSEDGKLLQLYYGAAVPERDYSYLVELQHRPMTTYRKEGDLRYSLEHVRQEFPEYGTTDFRRPAICLRQGNGSRITDFVYVSHQMVDGKPALEGLPATYTETQMEAKTLILTLRDELTEVEVQLFYTIFADWPVIARSSKVINQGRETCYLESLASLSLDLPDADYDWLQLSGAWARERHIKERPLQQGIQSIESTRGISSPHHNPFVALKRAETTEFSGPVLGAALVYSGNFLIQAEVDTYDVTRLQLGINPFGFEWKLAAGQSFTSPEALLVYSEQGLNGMSQVFHQLFRRRLARGYWRERVRPVLINNWEATYFDFSEDQLLELAEKAQEVGVELFVLDDGWFGQRTNDRAGLGDWFVNPERLPQGLGSLAERIHGLGMKFGLWFEPEMVNKDSQLYRSHPDWLLAVPDRQPYHGRNQFVLDYSRSEVVDEIFERLSAVIKEAQLDYIKWDMNRPLTDVFSAAWPADQQGEIFHSYVLGVYDLYERLISRYPSLLFESCSSGGGRFDPGMLYYTPQAWTSDDSDAIERLKIQYGTSLLYPLSSMGAHVSIVPNHQTNRLTPLKTRGNVAFFGSFGYELDFNQLSPEELAEVREQIDFYKRHRELIHNGTFYRLQSPFKGDGQTAWMVVSQDQNTALLGTFKVLNQVNRSHQRLQLKGLSVDKVYRLEERDYTGAELIRVGLVTTDASSGQLLEDSEQKPSYDFDSKLWLFEAEDE